MLISWAVRSVKKHNLKKKEAKKEASAGMSAQTQPPCERQTSSFANPTGIDESSSIEPGYKAQSDGSNAVLIESPPPYIYTNSASTRQPLADNAPITSPGYKEEKVSMSDMERHYSNKTANEG